MADTLPITVVLAVKNEEANIARCLEALKPAERVVVIDSSSTDRTADIARECGAEIVQFNHNGGYPKKRQWALDALTIETPWILLVDADEVVPDPLWKEIGSVIDDPDGSDAYLVLKGFHFMHKRFRFGGFSHSAVILFRNGRARFERIHIEPDDKMDMEVHERLIVDGSVGRLKTPLIHEDFKGLDAYIERHNEYAVWEAGVRRIFLETGRWGEDAIGARLFGNVQERRRFLKAIAVRTPFEPQLWFLYHYIFRLGFLEGRAGVIASCIRADYIRNVRQRTRRLLKRNHQPSTINH